MRPRGCRCTDGRAWRRRWRLRWLDATKPTGVPARPLSFVHSCAALHAGWLGFLNPSRAARWCRGRAFKAHTSGVLLVCATRYHNPSATPPMSAKANPFVLAKPALCLAVTSLGRHNGKSGPTGQWSNASCLRHRRSEEPFCNPFNPVQRLLQSPAAGMSIGLRLHGTGAAQGRCVCGNGGAGCARATSRGGVACAHLPRLGC